jgi:serine/threonine protein kinase
MHLGVSRYCKFIVEKRLGQSLNHIIRAQNRITLRDILQIGIETIKLIENLHKLDYIHCDIKPDNILTKFEIN